MCATAPTLRVFFRRYLVPLSHLTYGSRSTPSRSNLQGASDTSSSGQYRGGKLRSKGQSSGGGEGEEDPGDVDDVSSTKHLAKGSYSETATTGGTEIAEGHSPTASRGNSNSNPVHEYELSTWRNNVQRMEKYRETSTISQARSSTSGQEPTKPSTSFFGTAV
jgi:hypothetical protein